MIVATVLALTAAGLHAAWNLLAKRSDDRFLALWGQFAVAGVMSFVVVLAMPATCRRQHGCLPRSPV